MRASKREKLAGRGWKVGDASDFLSLSAEEEALISLRLKLAEGLKVRRVSKRLTQVELGESRTFQPVAGRQDGGWRPKRCH